MCIVLCPNSSLHCLFTCPLLNPVYFSSQNAWSYFEKKIQTGTVSVEVFTFHVHLAFERHTGTEGRELYFRAVFYFVRIPLPFELIFLHRCNKIHRLTSKRLLF